MPIRALPPDDEIIQRYTAPPASWKPGSYDRTGFSRVIAVHNSKGGAFKTAITTNIAAILAATGTAKVLVIDLDPQANCAPGLGVSDRSDNGASLLFSLMNGPDQPPLRVIAVRPNLDLVPGGPCLWHLDLERHENAPTNPFDLLIPGLDQIVDDYHIVLIDTGPGRSTALLAALGVARWLLVPTQITTGSRLGLEGVVDRLEEAHRYNPDLEVMGTVVVDLPANGTRLLTEGRGRLAQMVGEELVFKSSIRQAAAAAAACDEKGLTAIEIAEANENVKPLEYLRQGKRPPVTAQSAAGLSSDYISLTEEILNRISAAEADEESE